MIEHQFVLGRSRVSQVSHLVSAEDSLFLRVSLLWIVPSVRLLSDQDVASAVEEDR